MAADELHTEGQSCWADAARQRYAWHAEQRPDAIEERTAGGIERARCFPGCARRQQKIKLSHRVGKAVPAVPRQLARCVVGCSRKLQALFQPRPERAADLIPMVRVLPGEGPSRLVTVGREEYKGTVYNLKVGSGAELQSIGKDQTTVYANGFLVGDAQIQGDAESAELAASSQPAPLPARWRTDYQNSAKH